MKEEFYVAVGIILGLAFFYFIGVMTGMTV
jgi:hypothetical protein